ncbi:hypothetical protein [Anaeromyxobacter oryzae]|uniref:Uncharacterized protein n=1 Tax=Anaeromyxobacter oryzae TaxID=2918170 RepID=A0ABN6MSJ1_9BACT|nr:hypothetical protein [Anaeromyxobacter oryzae]BDG03947.1 hypothetical protein AMOR_29430 [Anaeromyxobacter oryzae]
MRWLARLAVPWTCAAGALALLPAAALAQSAGGSDPESGSRNFAWLWIVAAVLVIAALFRMFFGRPDRPAPPKAP